eukprot:CAMPEP_0170496596 /NCGR_PEP_ID=MMETSP0208-20121228/22246_1 /TAXON_ID=197538 /ORGANISM="Strombidium inclinatum, Strain S3" /LENGTH=36 /DNA_ID= /DNA_START= /DNA_END= /DNA_ORIENTATION=
MEKFLSDFDLTKIDELQDYKIHETLDKDKFSKLRSE